MNRPHCDATGFGWIEIDGERYEHDVLIRLGGKIQKRKKKLSKRIYGTSHTVSCDEAEHVFEKGARTLIIGEQTVKTHVAHILGKLGLSSRTQAALHAVRIGLASPDSPDP